MKKILSVMLVTCLCAVALLGGCAKESEKPAVQTTSQTVQSTQPEKETTSTSPAAKPAFLKFVTGSVGGGWYTQAGLLAETIKSGMPSGSDVTVVPGSGVSNIATISLHNADFGHAHTIYANWAYNGSGPFDKALPDIMGVTTLEENYIVVIATKNSGITSLSEVAEKKIPMKIVTMRPNSDGAGLLATYVGEQYGLGAPDLTKAFASLIGWGGKHIITTSHGESISNLIDGKGDVWVAVGSDGMAQVVELQASRDIVFLQIDQKVLDFMTEKYGIPQYTVPAGTFNSMTKDYVTMGVKSAFAANRNVSEDVVYRALKSLVDNRDTMIKAFPKMSAWNPKTSFEGIGYELHPGAIKYYKEVGYMK